MLKISPRLTGADRLKCLCCGFEECLKGPCLRFPQEILYFGEGSFYGVEVQRVAAQKPQLVSSLFDEFSDPFALVRGEVVHEHYLSGFQSRGEDVSHVEPERVGIGGPFDAHRWSHTLHTDRRD